MIGGGVESSKLLIMAWSFWRAALLPEHTKSHFRRTKDISVTQEIPRYVKSSVSGTRVKDQILEQKILLVLHLGNYRVLGDLCQELEPETNIFFSVISHTNF